MDEIRYVAIGDSFTEGVGDERPDGTPRGWADLVAEGWAASRGSEISYANLAIRGKLVWPIVAEQLEPALALRPTHLSFNGGGNDMLRPRTAISHVADAFDAVLRRCDEEGVTLVLLSGANPAPHLPMSRLIQRRGDELSAAVVSRVADRPDVVRALNWPDAELSTRGFWSDDRLHMNARGHHRVAARVLDALGERVPEGWWSQPADAVEKRSDGWGYYREHVGPWVQRRLTGRSSGDGRAPKYADWVTVAPTA